MSLIGDFKGVSGSLWGQILGWRVTFRTHIYGLLHTGNAILQLFRWKLSQKETLQHTFVMQYDITFTYSMFTFSDRTLVAIKYRILH